MNYIELGRQYQALKNSIDENIRDVIESSSFILGSMVSEFESKLAEYLGVKYAISCGNGTDALQLIYMAYGIGMGDAVFCPDMTFIASIEPACLLGATPVFCDIDPYNYNIDPDSLEKQIKAVISEGLLTAKAVVAVDFLGNPADFDRIRTITNKYNLLLIEDAAQAMGASYKGRKCGSLGDIAATSFFPSKPLGCYGDGGAVFTSDDKVADLIRSLRVHGKGVSKYENIHIGINSRLDTLQSAILLPKLAELDTEIEKRQRLARVYNEQLKNYYIIPKVEEHSVSSYAQYVVMASDSAEREHVQEHLKDRGIPTLRYYPNPMHMLPVFSDINNYTEVYSNTIDYAEKAFGIPFSAYLSDEEQQEVVSGLKNE